MLFIGKLVTCKKNEKEENGKKIVKFSNVGFIVDEEKNEKGFIDGTGRVLAVLVGKKYEGEADLSKCLNQRYFINVDTFKGEDGELNMLTYLGKTSPLSLD